MSAFSRAKRSSRVRSTSCRNGLAGVAMILALVVGAGGPGATSAQAAANPAKLVTKIRLGPSPFTPVLTGVGVDTATGMVYVAAYNAAFSNDGYVYVVHGDSVDATIHVCPNADGVAVDSNTDMVYV